MATSEKEKLSTIFNKQFRNTEKGAFSDGKHLFHSSNMHECRKMKRLKSHRERNLIRGYGQKASKSSSQQRHCHQLSSKDVAHFRSCCHGGSHHPLRRDVSSSNVIPIPQEPSIITENRLIGHQGLFNHEVKSIAIERLLSEQQKMEKSKVHEKRNATPHLSPASLAHSPSCSIECMVGDNEKLVLFEDKSDEGSKARDGLWDKEKDNIQGLAHTPERRPQQVPPELSPESCRLTNGTHIDDGRGKSRKGNHVTPVKEWETQVKSTAKGENTKTGKNAKEAISSLKNQECPGIHTQPHSLSPVKPSSPNSAEVDRGIDPRCGASHFALAADLCKSLKFPFLKKRSLVEESRQALLDALQESHGPQLQENLLQVWSSLSYDSNAKKGSLRQEKTIVDQDETFPKEFFTAFIPDSPPCFDNPRKASPKIGGSRHFSWKSSPKLPHYTKQVRPVETSVSFSDNIFGQTRSPELFMNFEPYGSTASEHLFTPSPMSSWGEKQSASPHWENRFNRSRGRDSERFDCFENSSNQTRVVRDSRSSGSRYRGSPPFFYQPRPHLQAAAWPVNCPQGQVPFETERYSFTLPSVQFQHQQGFHPTILPLSYFPHSSQLTDMDMFPPSHVLDKEPPPYFPSLEPWSFPPMRLY